MLRPRHGTRPRLSTPSTMLAVLDYKVNHMGAPLARPLSSRLAVRPLSSRLAGVEFATPSRSGSSVRPRARRLVNHKPRGRWRVPRPGQTDSIPLVGPRGNACHALTASSEHVLVNSRTRRFQINRIGSLPPTLPGQPGGHRREAFRINVRRSGRRFAHVLASASADDRIRAQCRRSAPSQGPPGAPRSRYS